MWFSSRAVVVIPSAPRDERACVCACAGTDYVHSATSAAEAVAILHIIIIIIIRSSAIVNANT